MALNFSTQLIPLGSSSENTKQEKASLNWGPHGPCAIPPRHGQSQLISPVVGLKAPADSSSPGSVPGSASFGVGAGVLLELDAGASEGVGGGGGSD
jgi:hypothetical protein